MNTLVLLGLLLGCGESAPDAQGAWTPVELAQLERLRLDVRLKPDLSNRVADDPAAARFGQALFYDPGLSPGGVSCATCHDPSKHFTDGRERGEGVGIADRHTPSVVGSQLGPWFFWDGRADSLWSQASGPIENPVEMASDRVYVVRQVEQRYRAEYELSFGPLPSLEGLPLRAGPGLAGPSGEAWRALREEQQEQVTKAYVDVLKAIAAYERQLVPTEAPFDRYVDAVRAGDVEGQAILDEEQVRGLKFFMREGNCISCHNGPFFTDRAFHNLGLPEAYVRYDPGRTMGAMTVRQSEMKCGSAWSDAPDCAELGFLNPNFDDFQAAFKTPSLRNVVETAPYMHNGQLVDLDAVLDFYSELPTQPLAGHRELTLQPLKLTPDERSALKSFLTSLSGGPFPAELIGPPSKLP